MSLCVCVQVPCVHVCAGAGVGGWGWAPLLSSLVPSLPYQFGPQPKVDSRGNKVDSMLSLLIYLNCPELAVNSTFQ